MADVTLALTGLASTGAVGTVRAGTSANVYGVETDSAINGLGAPGTVSMTMPTPQFLATANAAFFGLLPVPTFSAAGMAGAVGTVSLTLPLPQLTLSVLGRDGPLFEATLHLPLPQLQTSGVTGVSGTVQLTLPTPQLQIVVPDTAALQLPTPQLQAQGTTGVTATVDLTLPMPQLMAIGAVPFVGDMALALPVPTVEIAGSTGASARMNAQLASFALSIAGATGVLGTVAMVLPVGRFTASGYQPGIGAVQLVLPALQLQVTGHAGSVAGGVVGASPVTVAMQTEMLSLSTYSNYPFNSYAKFNGMFLGASDAGVFALTGATDNGVPIQAAARVGMSDFGTSHLKRLDKIYVGYRADGNLILRVFTDEVTQRDYLLTSTQQRGLHGNHTRLGKGLVARYWQFEVRNQNGGDFSLDIIELKPVKLARRVGGRDA
jgi:hypothetical protein